MIKKCLFAALAVFALDGYAQTPAAEALTVEKRVALAELLEVINFKQTMSQMTNSMIQAVPQAIAQSTTQLSMTLPPEEQARIREEAKAAMATSMQNISALYTDPIIIQGMEDIMARAFAKHFSVVEIKHIAAFYKTEAGKKMLTVSPQLMQETMPEMMALVSPRMNEIIASTAKQAVAKGKTGKAVSPAK